MISILIKKATLLCPTTKYHLKKKDILIKNGVIEKIADSIDQKTTYRIDEKNTFVSTGWMDLFADFCEPGFEHKENLHSGSMTALAGGYTDVCIIPDTRPATTSKAGIAFIKNKSKQVNLHPVGAVSARMEGNDLAEMYDMRVSGAVAFSDGKKPVQNAGLLLKALQYIKPFNGVLIQIPEDTSIAKNGLMHEGIVSTALGVQGKPAMAETIAIQRDLELLRYADSHLHITGVSTKKSLELIRQAKKQGLHVTCSVTPYHLLFTDEQLNSYDPNFKVSPPLRTEEDRLALIKGILDQTIDAISTHHFPQDWDAKNVEFEYAGPGIISLQTTLPMLLAVSPEIGIAQWTELITTNPRQIFGLKQPEIKVGAQACLTIFNTHKTWLFDQQSNKSKSSNSPLFNKLLKGKVTAVVNNHQIYMNE